ncbi:MAG TPA: FAD-binding protein, partial [Solirubrobacter sp.]|nr:FAD-binding protein [Solirubrobacter sp.]
MDVLGAGRLDDRGGPLGPLADTVLLNVSQLDSVAIDAQARRVRVGAGVRWEQVVPQLSELGLAALHGSSPDVGIAGYSLGGGMGWLARKHGLQTNSVTAFELVTADGHLVRADACHEPELFWALRGGGGNFGVVTAIEFAVFPYAELYAGASFFPFARTR